MYLPYSYEEDTEARLVSELGRLYLSGTDEDTSTQIPIHSNFLGLRT